MKFIATLAAAILCLTPPIGAQPVISQGRPMPVIELPTLTGGTGSIEDFRGERVILHLFASW